MLILLTASRTMFVTYMMYRFAFSAGRCTQLCVNINRQPRGISQHGEFFVQSVELICVQLTWTWVLWCYMSIRPHTDIHQVTIEYVKELRCSNGKWKYNLLGLGARDHRRRTQGSCRWTVPNWYAWWRMFHFATQPETHLPAYVLQLHSVSHCHNQP